MFKKWIEEFERHFLLKLAYKYWDGQKDNDGQIIFYTGITVVKVYPSKEEEAK